MFMKQSADLWIFDEPTNDLDIETIEILERELKSYDAAVIIIGHDRAFLDNICQNTWLIHENSIEIFEGGYTQVAPFLHAIEMEKQSKANETKQNKKNESKQQESSKAQKMNYKQKQRFACIEDEIAQAEASLEALSVELANFDFSKNDQVLQEKYQSLDNSKSKQERELEKLYLEWEELSEMTE